MATFEVRTNVPYAVVSYGNRFSTSKMTADSHGVARFEWADFAVYVNAQKTDYVFSDKILPRLPAEQSWGQTSEWYLMSRFNPTKELYGLHKLDVPAEKLLEEAEAARRKAEEEARKLKAQAEEEARRIAAEAEERARALRERAEEVCTEFVTSAACSVPRELSANFPVVIRNAKWTCVDTGEFEKVTGNAKVRIEGYEFEVPIQNGFGQMNIGVTPAFGDLLRKLVG
jgi:hypothetical protein